MGVREKQPVGRTAPARRAKARPAPLMMGRDIVIEQKLTISRDLGGSR